MFDTSIVKAHALAAPRRTTLIISLLIHSVAVVAAVGLSVTSAQAPPESPRPMELYRPVEAPPAPPGPPIGHHPRQVESRQQPPAEPHEITAPAEIPQNTPVAVQPSDLIADPAAPADGPIGEPTGQKNGIPGGKGVATGGEETQTTPYTPGTLGVTSAKVIKRVEPRFPSALIHAVNHAEVVVLCVIGKDGRIRDPQIVRSTFEPFNFAVIEAVRQWEFEPGRMHGEPVDTYFELTVKFEVKR